MSKLDDPLHWTRTLHEDLDIAMKRVDQEDTPFNRRTLVRTFCAYVEGDTFARKQLALEIGQAQPGINFSPGELSIIHEASYGLTSEGVIAPGPNWPKFLSNIRFSFRILAKALSYDRWPKHEVALPQSNEEWGLLKAVQGVRSRLMHPSGAEDLIVTGNEMRTLNRALEFYVGMQRAFVREMASEILDAREFARSFIKYADPEVHAEAIERFKRILPEHQDDSLDDA